MTKYFIITNGPTGSGKSGLVKKTLDYLGVENYAEKITKFLIDDLVENDSMYKAEVKDIITEVETKCHEHLSSSSSSSSIYNECKERALKYPSIELVDKFALAYFHTRKHGCENLRHIGDNCDAVLENQLAMINEKKPEIVVFEMTGTYIPAWLLCDKFIPIDYTIIVSYSLVNLENLVQRNQGRAYQALQQFEENDSNPAPRFPNTSLETFKPIVRKIKDVLFELYESCIENGNSNNGKCGNRDIAKLLLFDNNEASSRLIFDSSSPLSSSTLSRKNLYELINQSFGDMHREGGEKGGGGRKQKFSMKKKKRYLKSRKRKMKTKRNGL